MHPGTVWSLSINKLNFDMITGCSDNVIRVFTLDPKRYADKSELDEYENQV